MLAIIESISVRISTVIIFVRTMNELSSIGFTSIRAGLVIHVSLSNGMYLEAKCLA